MNPSELFIQFIEEFRCVLLSDQFYYLRCLLYRGALAQDPLDGSLTLFIKACSSSQRRYNG